MSSRTSVQELLLGQHRPSKKKERLTVRVNLDLPMEDKALIGLACFQLKEQAKEAAEKIDRRWKITQVMFGVCKILLQAAGTLLNNF